MEKNLSEYCLAEGWLQPARHCPSPNWNQRPANAIIDLIVIHNISLPPGQFGGPFIDQLFSNQLDRTAHPYFEQIADLEVSSHLLIRRDGSLTQYVPLHLRAWHAGRSCFQGRDNCNDFSIGIELEGTDEQPYTEAQYQQLAQVIRCCQSSLGKMQLAGHCDIAPQRKTDPGPAFNWDYLHKLLA